MVNTNKPVREEYASLCFKTMTRAQNVKCDIREGKEIKSEMGLKMARVT